MEKEVDADYAYEKLRLKAERVTGMKIEYLYEHEAQEGESMKAIRKKPGCAPELIDIDNTLKALQAEVDGYIETVTIASDAVVICNEEGRLRGMSYNCLFFGMVFVGTILVVGRNKDEFCDVPEADFLMYHLRDEDNTHDD